MMSASCSYQLRRPSPTAEGTNRLLWGDWERGEVGLIIRMPDHYDTEDGSSNNLIPASFAHASLRTANIIFTDTYQGSAGAGFIVGSRFTRNWSMNKKLANTSELVSSPVCYPTDAGTDDRTIINTMNSTWASQNGVGCNPNRPKEEVCINSTCLFTTTNNCACNMNDVPGNSVGEFITKWAANVGYDFWWLNSWVACWYGNDTMEMREMIAASNSLWNARNKWPTTAIDSAYRGWTECMITANARAQEDSKSF